MVDLTPKTKYLFCSAQIFVKFGSWDSEFRNLDVGNETADLTLSLGDLDSGAGCMCGCALCELEFDLYQYTLYLRDAALSFLRPLYITN